MRGIEFTGVNAHPGAPEGMSEAECGALPVRVCIDSELNQVVCVSCFEVHPIELEEMIRQAKEDGSAKVYLKVVGWQVPVALSGGFEFNDVRDLTDEEKIKLYGKAK